LTAAVATSTRTAEELVATVTFPVRTAVVARQSTVAPAANTPSAMNSETNGSMRSWPWGCEKSGGLVVK
jgi:hypothetical protein